MLVKTLKGFRDYLPQEARKRQFVMSTLKNVFELYGFEPLETPVLEYEEILTGKYGEEGEKLMYRFEDLGKRRVAMRYDLTIPLSRVVAQYQNDLSIPFKRYQMQNVWRAENTQKGRLREFIQCDIDTVGVSSALADAEIILITYAVFERFRFSDYKILINDRSVFEGLPMSAITTIDKLKKIGEESVCNELVKKGITNSREEANNLLQSITQKALTPRLQEILTLLDHYGVPKNMLEFSPTLARGLDYYTGLIVEVESPNYPFGSLAGGGRYDNLIGMFTDRKIPAVGISFGRIFDAVDALHLYPPELDNASTKALITIFSEELKELSVKTSFFLREKNINTELYLDATTRLEKQLKYADQKGIPFAVIIGPEEAEKNIVTLKNLQTREQLQLPLEEVTKKLLQ
ncbi:MAG TPA: histidine--tRNA ligase [Patescibacteria group bacterium]|nr:histidine--tRNA ligase [Patescibacteria group bacterium]